MGRNYLEEPSRPSLSTRFVDGITNLLSGSHLSRVDVLPQSWYEIENYLAEATSFSVTEHKMIESIRGLESYNPDLAGISQGFSSQTAELLKRVADLLHQNHLDKAIKVGLNPKTHFAELQPIEGYSFTVEKKYGEDIDHEAHFMGTTVAILQHSNEANKIQAAMDRISL